MYLSATDGYPEQPQSMAARVHWDYFDGTHCYEVRFDGGPGSWKRVYVTNAVIGCLQHGATYRIRVKACDIVGNRAQQTDVDDRMPPLPTP